MGSRSKSNNTADQKAQHASNCELVEAAGRLGDVGAATAHIRATQGHKAAMAALLDEVNRRR